MGSGGEEEEERALEDELELQVQEQKDSLAAINDAVSSDPSNPELISVQEELVHAIKDAEEGLFHLKRARLLREADAALLRGSVDVDVKAEEPLGRAGSEPDAVEDGGFSVGSKCRFKYADGRWYNGRIVEMGGQGTAKISFLTPTSDSMLMCNFFLQQRCRFGSSCRLSHGVDVPLFSLKKYVSPLWDHSLVGSKVWAVSNNNTGIYRKGELELWDDKLKVGQVVFRGDGSTVKVGSESMALSEYAWMSDEERSYSSSDQSDSSDYEEESVEGLGFLESTNLQRGVQTETSVFATWENHTRGIASKMMTNMGYREGTGLGASGQGMLHPIPVQVLPPKLSLDHALESQKVDVPGSSLGKKRSRGGKRKRDKKFAKAARAAKTEEENRPDVFSLINGQLAKHHQAMSGQLPRTKQTKGSGEKKVDRRSLVAYDEEVKDLKLQVEKLEEMASRNRKEKVVYEAAMRKLTETRKALAEVEAAHASASDAVSAKEKEKKWLKF